MAGSFTVLSHTADTAIGVRADSLAELFEWAAIGMCSLVYDIESAVPQRTVEIEVQADGFDELLVDALSEILYWSEADDVVPCTVTVDDVSSAQVRMTVGVAAQDPERLIGPPIKAVTYHDLYVEERRPGRWEARVVFDV
jgi:SHS2 domain-containing protein